MDRRLYETALFAHVRNKLRSGDVWVERSDGYRRFDSYLLPLAEAVPIAAGLGLPAAADEWLDGQIDLDAEILTPRGERTSVRDVLIHMIEEYARHCGHADLLRECIDGRTGQ